MRNQSVVVACVSALLLSVYGCGGAASDEPDLGEVTGVVLLDGEPAVGVQVVFAPQSAGGDAAGNVGGISTAETDAEGRYVLTYKDGVPGAAIGKHLVQIMRAAGVLPNEDGSVPPPSGPPIPAKYGFDSQETREVAAGENVFDFNLESK